MARTPETKEYWEAEEKFIRCEAAKQHRMGGFDEYCLMQRNFAYSDGFVDISNTISDAAGIRPATAESHAAWLAALRRPPE